MMGTGEDSAEKITFGIISLSVGRRWTLDSRMRAEGSDDDRRQLDTEYRVPFLGIRCSHYIAARRNFYSYTTYKKKNRPASKQGMGIFAVFRQSIM